ncbi:unnamed protein product, partial [Choristocarpus tenellus]
EKKKDPEPQVNVDPNKKSKKQLQREKKEAEKAAAKAEREKKQVEEKVQAATLESGPEGQEWRFGNLPIIQSSEITGKVFCPIDKLSAAKSGEDLWVRARVHTSRSIKKGVFLVLRSSYFTVQATAFVEGNITRALVTYATAISRESVVDVRGTVVIAPSPVSGCTQQDIELKIEEVHVVSEADTFLPLIVADASRPDLTPEEEKQEEKDGKVPRVGPDTRLDYRWIDFRTPANQAIFHVQSEVCQQFRAYLSSKGFLEIHSPKLLGGASEGGSNVFTLDYFGHPACLAQSPQLYKQMAAACGGFGRVMEVRFGRRVNGAIFVVCYVVLGLHSAACAYEETTEFFACIGILVSSWMCTFVRLHRFVLYFEVQAVPFQRIFVSFNQQCLSRTVDSLWCLVCSSTRFLVNRCILYCHFWNFSLEVLIFIQIAARKLSCLGEVTLH